MSIIERMKKECFISADCINDLFQQIKVELERHFPDKTITYTRIFSNNTIFKSIEVFENIEDIRIFLESIQRNSNEPRSN